MREADFEGKKKLILQHTPSLDNKVHFCVWSIVLVVDDDEIRCRGGSLRNGWDKAKDRPGRRQEKILGAR